MTKTEQSMARNINGSQKKKKEEKISVCDEIEMEALRKRGGETQSCI